jgi:acyl-CoA thioester hydrolase
MTAPDSPNAPPESQGADTAPAGPAIDLKDRSVYGEWTSDTIRYRDLDPNSHVNNGAINEFFEDGRVQFRVAHMAELDEKILTGFAMVRFTATYHALLYFPGTVDVGTAVMRIGRSSFDLGQGVFRGDGGGGGDGGNGGGGDGGDECIATAEVVSVFFDPATGKSVPLPDALREVLTKAMAKG